MPKHLAVEAIFWSKQNINIYSLIAVSVFQLLNPIDHFDDLIGDQLHRSFPFFRRRLFRISPYTSGPILYLVPNTEGFWDSGIPFVSPSLTRWGDK